MPRHYEPILETGNFVDPLHDNAPHGGYVHAMGVDIHFQEGPTGEQNGYPPRNGAFVEDIIEAARQRLEFFQMERFNHPMNDLAIRHLNAALDCLDIRMRERICRGVYGTHNL